LKHLERDGDRRADGGRRLAVLTAEKAAVFGEELEVEVGRRWRGSKGRRWVEVEA
jgi:hypothetical protein